MLLFRVESTQILSSLISGLKMTVNDWSGQFPQNNNDNNDNNDNEAVTDKY